MSYFDKFKKGKYKGKTTRQKIWHFIWHEDSIESWIINIILAFILIKYLVYPGLGFALATSHPIVAVVSGSMHHDVGFNDYWEETGAWYEKNGISKEDFRDFPMHNGFNKGDIMILHGTKTEKIKEGDVIVFVGHRTNPRPDPIIHRVVANMETDTGNRVVTKGDNYLTNPESINTCSARGGCLDETDIRDNQIIGKAFIRVPYLGYVKIGAVELICLFNDFNFCIR